MPTLQRLTVGMRARGRLAMAMMWGFLPSIGWTIERRRLAGDFAVRRVNGPAVPGMSAAAAERRMMHGKEQRLACARSRITRGFDFFKLLHQEIELSVTDDVGTCDVGVLTNGAHVFAAVREQDDDVGQWRVDP